MLHVFLNYQIFTLQINKILDLLVRDLVCTFVWHKFLIQIRGPGDCSGELYLSFHPNNDVARSTFWAGNSDSHRSILCEAFQFSWTHCHVATILRVPTTFISKVHLGCYFVKTPKHLLHETIDWKLILKSFQSPNDMLSPTTRPARILLIQCAQCLNTAFLQLSPTNSINSWNQHLSIST